ncbi:hypothetical protein MFRU_035g00560 [Monilinia fructicola]|nr:hypothetical protein MFRU_035g00560 [Monilinia fructicola]
MSSDKASNPMGTCPLGGQWWTCQDQSPTFLGCCLSDPCNGIGCPANDLTAAGMGTGNDPNDPNNNGTYWPNAGCPNGGAWWTCAEQTPSFQGCCDASGDFNPCHRNGCPLERLHPAAFNTVPATIVSTVSFKISTSPALSSSKIQSSHLTSSSVTANPTAAAGFTSQTVSTHASSTVDATTDSIEQNSHQKLPIAVVLGGALGGLVVFLLVILALFCVKRRRKRAILTGSIQPDYQLQPDMSMTKVTPSSFLYEASPSDTKVPLKGYRPIVNTPSSSPLSPAPPYRSAPQSPELSDHQEIDSIAVHEIESPPLQQWSFISQPGIVEMPDTSRDSREASILQVLKPGACQK